MPKRAHRKDYPPPEFFTDRGLGRHTVPQALRDAGLVVHVMHDEFGDDPKWRPDRVWIPEVTKRAWVILMKDDQIRMKPLEREALISCGAKAFCITNAQIKGEDMATRFVDNLPRILRACRKPGPFVYGVYPKELTRLFPRDPARQSRRSK